MRTLQRFGKISFFYFTACCLIPRPAVAIMATKLVLATAHPDRVTMTTDDDDTTVDTIFAKHCIAYDPNPSTNPDGPQAGRLSMIVSPVLTQLTADGQVMIDTESEGVATWAASNGIAETELTKRLTAAVVDFAAQEGITNNPLLLIPNRP
jgi:hypothetical protein